MNGDLLAQLQAENARLRAENTRLESLVKQSCRERDIAEREGAEEALRESEERFSTFMDNLPVAVFMHDANSRNVYFNRYIAEHFGDFTGKTALDLFPAETAQQMMADDRRVLAEGCSWVREENVPDDDGQLLTFQTIKFPIERAGKPPLIGGFAIDITDLKRAEENIKKTANEMQWLMKSMANAFVVWESVFDEAGKFTNFRFGYFNDAYEKVLGLKLEEVQGKTVLEIWPETEQSWFDVYSEVAITGNSKSFEMYHSPTRGLYACNAYRPWSTPDRICVVFEDVTERRHAEQALLESERKYRELVENANSIILRWNRQGEITFMNEFGLKFFGYSAEELLGRHVMDAIVPPSESTGRDLRPLMDEICLHPERFERNVNENMRRGGERAWVAWTNKTVLDEQGQVREVFSIGSDITERKRAEEKLADSEARYYSLFETAPDAIIIMDLKTLRVVNANQAACELYGYSREEFLLLSAPDISAEPEQTRSTIREGIAFIPSRYHKKKDGTMFAVEIKAGFFQSDARQTCVAFVRDITEKKRVEEALKFTQFAVDHTGDAAYWMDSDGRFIYVNEAACRALGYSREELLSLSVPDIGPAFPQDVWDRHWQELKERGNLIFENLHRAKDGRIFPVEIRANFVAFADKEYNCAFVRDITKRKQAEERIEASLQEKEVLLKEIHHRVKNNLQIIYSLLDLQANQIDHPDARSALRESQNRVRSMALIHERLYRSQNLARVDFAAYLDNLVNSLFQSYVVRTGAVSLRIDALPLLLSIDKALPCGLIINELLTNALRHGFPDGLSGEIGIQMQSLDNRRVFLRIWDTGVGFPVGLDFRQTTSLGLMIVNTLVNQLRGSIDLHRESGTDFRIVFTDDAPTD